MVHRGYTLQKRYSNLDSSIFQVKIKLVLGATKEWAFSPDTSVLCGGLIFNMAHRPLPKALSVAWHPLMCTYFFQSWAQTHTNVPGSCLWSKCQWWFGIDGPPSSRLASFPLLAVLHFPGTLVAVPFLSIHGTYIFSIAPCSWDWPYRLN